MTGNLLGEEFDPFVFEQIKKKEPTQKLKELKKKGLINYDL